MGMCVCVAKDAQVTQSVIQLNEKNHMATLPIACYAQRECTLKGKNSGMNDI